MHFCQKTIENVDTKTIFTFDSKTLHHGNRKSTKNQDNVLTDGVTR